MKHYKLLFLAVFLTIHLKSNSQCNQEQTITICDMTIIDGDNDGTPDGVINLFNTYNDIVGVIPISSSDGQWFDPNFNYALNEVNGNLHLWDLSNSSEVNSTYHFQFIDTNSTCPDGILIDLNIVLGAFSGFSVPTIGVNDVNIEICDSPEPFTRCNIPVSFDLFHTLLSTPSAHSNGVWTYEGNSSNFLGIDDDRYLIVDIPYQAGPPLIDDEVFELKYTVQGIAPCNDVMETVVKVSVVRSAFSGFANSINICEEALLAGDYNDINLLDDAYLVNEDIEGTWSSLNDPTNQIATPNDSQVNFVEVYENLIQTNPRFGCQRFTYTYSVDSRSNVCFDIESNVNFTIFESIRPFSQDVPKEICIGQNPSSINLFDLISFTEEDGVVYDYTHNKYTNWTFVSGPSDLGLVSNIGEIGSVVEDPNYSAFGTIDLSNLTNVDAGTYVFEFTVDEEYNCKMHPIIGDVFFNGEIIYETPDGCGFSDSAEPPCGGTSALVTLIIHPYNYPGENTNGLEFCESDISNPVDLISLLQTNGVDTIYIGANTQWINLDDNTSINNPFSIPDFDEQMTFNFQYQIAANGCEETADLHFTIYKQNEPGINNTISVCVEDASFELFDLLGGSPMEIGTWSGPNNFSSSSNLVTINPETFVSGDYIYTVPSNGLCDEKTAVVTLDIQAVNNAGNDVQEQVCILDGVVDLFSLLDNDADFSGAFLDIDNTNALNNSNVNLSLLSNGFYHFEYKVQTSTSCDAVSSIITLEVVSTPIPLVANQEFCLGYGATVADLVVDTVFVEMNWYGTLTDIQALDISETLVNNEDYFVAVVDDTTGCESEREKVTVTLTQFGENGCVPCIADGLTPNNDGQNDELSLCDLPNIFPDFEMTIFNRYGNIIYKGNKNTPLFHGISNVSLTLGKQIPSGVYFYIFNPKNDSTATIQGDFYLSR